MSSAFPVISSSKNTGGYRFVRCNTAAALAAAAAATAARPVGKVASFHRPVCASKTASLQALRRAIPDHACRLDPRRSQPCLMATQTRFSNESTRNMQSYHAHQTEENTEQDPLCDLAAEMLTHASRGVPSFTREQGHLRQLPDALACTTHPDQQTWEYRTQSHIKTSTHAHQPGYRDRCSTTRHTPKTRHETEEHRRGFEIGTGAPSQLTSLGFRNTLLFVSLSKTSSSSPRCILNQRVPRQSGPSGSSFMVDGRRIKIAASLCDLTRFVGFCGLCGLKFTVLTFCFLVGSRTSYPPP